MTFYQSYNIRIIQIILDYLIGQISICGICLLSKFS